MTARLYAVPVGIEECIDGDQPRGFTSVEEGIERLLHRNGSRRSAVSGARSRLRLRRGGHVRTWCPYGVAHPSTRANTRRDGGFRSRAAMDGPIEEIRPSDVVWFPPGEKHWHGPHPQRP